MERETSNYCLILEDRLESLIYLVRAAKKGGNSILCYCFCDRDGNQCAFPVASTLYESGDFTVLSELYASSPIYLDKDFKNQIIYVNNAACDRLFAKKISEIERKYILSSTDVISSFMHQMGFPDECVDEYRKDGTVYLYDGFYREKITENTFPEIKAAIDAFYGDVYAVVSDHFENTYAYLIWNPGKNPNQLTPLTKDKRFGKTSLVRCIFDKHVDEYFYIGLMTSAGGVWSIPNDIASTKHYKYSFESFSDLD